VTGLIERLSVDDFLSMVENYCQQRSYCLRLHEGEWSIDKGVEIE